MERVVGLNFFLYSAVVAGFAIAISSIGCGYSQGIAIRSAVEGVARNPEASGKITVTMMIGLAMIESLCIYTLVICLILIYANPVSKLIQGFVGLVH
ncbi:MAG: ATP synthase F0 subunit C [Syntrophobacteria bacterium]